MGVEQDCSNTEEEDGYNAESDLEVIITLKGTVRLISRDPPCKDGNARFTRGIL